MGRGGGGARREQCSRSLLYAEGTVGFSKEFGGVVSYGLELTDTSPKDVSRIPMPVDHSHYPNQP